MSQCARDLLLEERKCHTFKAQKNDQTVSNLQNQLYHLILHYMYIFLYRLLIIFNFN